MRRIMLIILCGTLLLSGSVVKAVEEEEPTWTERLRESAIEQAVDKLEQLELVHNPKERWTREDYITRRDAFSLTYMVKSGTKEYYTDEDSTAEEDLLRIPKQGFADVDRQSEDADLLVSLLAEKLISGKCKTKNYFAESSEYYHYSNMWEEGDYPTADFDSFTTYEEALTMIGRLFNDYRVTHMFNDFPYDEDHEYFVYAERLGLINNESPMQEAGTPVITEEQLDDYIPAWEFMHLLYRAMFIPCALITGYTDHGNYHYIDQFIGVEPKDAYIVNNHPMKIDL